ncbi:type VII secretion protein EccCa [Dactylosporangium fulvum]|uniref:Type VII secretion protein EccCa n=1 Tax=Dactylosporangium fulvum TaxID=53359 RepID=A0ABY5W0D6_9ACTN|nr:type VII secretion protein EccCa [Dactylosporangium fulvum]UWP82183.1 type VII secretion protein EccCa [Dactylosporangium fulvum]
MSTVIRRRPARRPAPPYPSGEIVLEAAPEIPAPGGRGWTHLLMLLPMLAGSLAIALIFAGQRGSSGPWAYLTGGLFGISAIGMLLMQFSLHGSGATKQEMHRVRREYLWDLDACRRTVRRTAREQRAAEYYRHPAPWSLWALVDSARLWERRATDLDHGLVRIGLGPRELATRLVAGPATPPEKAEPVAAAALRRFLQTYSELPDLPVVLALNGFGRVYIEGDHARARSMIRALIAQAATFHSPDTLLIAICLNSDTRPHWEWTKWLPHSQHPTAVDALGPLRLIAPALVGLEAMLDDLLANRPRFDPGGAESSHDGAHVLVIVDEGDIAGADHLAAEAGVEGVTVIDMSNPPPRNIERATLVLRVDADGTLTGRTFDGVRPLGHADEFGRLAAEALAQQLSPLRLAAASRGDRAMNAEHGLAELLNIPDPATLDPNLTWAPRPTRDRLRVPIGIGRDGERLELDLKESAQDGMGPHGLLIGATGSGKSELLRTLVLALAITHPPEILNFVLVDFKGGATFTRLDLLPHTSAVITNLADELPLVDRMTDAINGELVRRQELLRKAGNYVSQRDYERARLAGAPLTPLPSLFVVCDEFSELLSAKPDFIEMFVQIGRVGRSLGIHLLLASQRLEEGRLRGLDTHLSYRIGLRTFSPSESRTVLGVNDAYELPRAPGHGFLKFGTELLSRFRAAYVSGVYRSRSQVEASSGDARVHEYVSTYVAEVEEEPGPAPEVEEDETVGGPTLLDILTQRLVGHGTPAHQVWLPPLDEPPTLDDLLGPLHRDETRGLTVADASTTGQLRVPVSVVDKPFEQRRDVLALDLSGGHGHVAVIGSPQAGKSTLLRTVLCSLALTHTPREVQLYCLDFGGASLSALRGLPHVGGMAARHEVDLVRRTVAEVLGVLNDRERLFAKHGIDSMSTFRRLRAAGEFAEQAHGDVFLVIDGWLTVRNEFEDLEDPITDIANRGLSYGVHVVIATNRWYDVRSTIRDSFGTRLELRLADPSDSMIDRRAAANIPDRSPGRGITPDGHQCLAALPRIDGVVDTGDLAEATQALVAAVRDAWKGSTAPSVRLLPDRIAVRDLPQGPDAPGIAIGIAESDLGPAYLDLTSADHHFLLFGDTESGKSTFLAAFAQALSVRYQPSQAKIIALDYRRSLLGRLPESHLLAYGTSGEASHKLLSEAAVVMRERMPGPDVTTEQLRSRSWWRGPDLYVLVDDYDLVSTDRNPVHVLHEFIAHSREVGLHLVIARRSGGAQRAFYDPVLSRLRDLASPGLVLSGDREDGPLLGNVKLRQLPPGRGFLVTRKEDARLIQCGWLE